MFHVEHFVFGWKLGEMGTPNRSSPSASSGQALDSAALRSDDKS